MNHRLACEAYAEFLEDFSVNLAEHRRGVNLAAVQLWQASQRLAAVLVVETQHRKGYENLVGVKPWIMPVKQVDFGVLDWLYHVLRDELYVVADACKMFCCVENQCRACSQQRAALRRDDGAVGEFNGRRRHAALFLFFLGGYGGLSHFRGNLGLLHQEREFIHLVLARFSLSEIAKGRVIAAYYLLARRLAARLVVRDAKSHHVDTHVGGRLVRVLAVYAFEDGV